MAGRSPVTRDQSGPNAAALAANLAFTGAFAALPGAGLWLPASDLILTVNVPTLSYVAGGTELRPPIWLLDAASPERVSGTRLIPAGWSTVDILALWTNVGAGAGDVAWAAGYSSLVDTEDLTTGTAWTTTGIVTAAAVNILKTTTLLSAVAVTAGDLFTVQVGRKADDGSDTLANDIGLLGVLLRRAS